MSEEKTKIKRWDAELLKIKRANELQKKYLFSEIQVHNTELIKRFLEITERRVSTIDEYGDENFDALDEQIGIVLKKIAKVMRIKQTFIVEKPVQIKKQGNYFGKLSTKHEIIHSAFSKLRSELKKKFREYHRAQKKFKNSITEFNTLSGVEFETFIANLLQNNGYLNIRGTPATGDQGADLIAEKAGRTIIIQAKRYQGAVGNKAVQEVISALQFYSGDEGWVVTNSNFTPSARALASKSGIKLVDGYYLKNFERNQKNGTQGVY